MPKTGPYRIRNLVPDHDWKYHRAQEHYYFHLDNELEKEVFERFYTIRTYHEYDGYFSIIDIYHKLRCLGTYNEVRCIVRHIYKFGLLERNDRGEYRITSEGIKYYEKRY
jgi:hypothetical protein